MRCPARTLLDNAASLGSLGAAWEDVASGTNPTGEVAGSILKFGKRLEDNLNQLHDRLTSKTYTPAHLHQVIIPKPDGGQRLLAIPRVSDRVVERAVLNAVTPFVDPWLGPASYAYRPGLGVADAVQTVARLRDEGLSWVLRADVDDCFGSIPRPRAVRHLFTLLPDESLNELIERLTTRKVLTQRGLRDVSGVPQGTSLSPLLANLVLVDLDNALLDRGFPVVRYADDYTVGCSSSKEAQEAQRVAADTLGELGMKMSAEKTAVMSFDEGFCFLGEDFGPRYPPVNDHHRTSEPLRRTVYIALQGSRSFIKQGKLTVTSRDDQQVLDVPSSHVGRLVLFGSVGLSSGLRSWALECGVDVVFLTRRGAYLGQALAGSSGRRVARLRCQSEFTENVTRVRLFIRAVVEAKIRHQMTVLQRLGRREHADELVGHLRQLRTLVAMVQQVESPAEAMGVEGAAARAYFQALAVLLPEGLGFQGRTRRPPMDVVNSALSYGYALLLAEAVSALCAAGLDPGFGLLHAENEKRPSLALDLMEEFRPLVVDQVVATLARRDSLNSDHGHRRAGESGTWLTKAGKERLVDAYERRMLQITSGALPGFTGSLRRHLYRQAERLAAFIADDSNAWTGLSWR